MDMRGALVHCRLMYRLKNFIHVSIVEEEVNMKGKSGMRNMLLGAALGMALMAPAQSSCAPAQQDTPPPVDRFTVMDANRDGKVLLEEFQAASPNMNEQAFIMIDRNKDNAIDRVEWEEFIENHGSGMRRQEGAPMNNIPGDPLIPPPDSSDLPLVRPPMN